jgi:hypothetical protein
MDDIVTTIPPVTMNFHHVRGLIELPCSKKYFACHFADEYVKGFPYLSFFF